MDAKCIRFHTKALRKYSLFFFIQIISKTFIILYISLVFLLDVKQIAFRGVIHLTAKHLSPKRSLT